MSVWDDGKGRLWRWCVFVCIYGRRGGGVEIKCSKFTDREKNLLIGKKLGLPISLIGNINFVIDIPGY